MALSYAFDPSKGETPETIARRRQTADLIASRIFGKAPANVGEGLNAIGQALIARQMQGEANDAMKAGMATAPEMFGGTGANPAAGIAASIAGQPIAPTVATPAGQTSIPGGSGEFTNTVMPLAEDASAKTGVDPRIIGAQAILETGNGKSAPGNNLFGIKSHGQPGGNVLPTTEVVNGQPVRTTDSFAAYASPQDSANGYSNFLQSNPRYKPMMAAPTLEGQAAALGQSGYATDPNYGSKVLGIAKGLPAPTGGILADNSASPLDNAQYPAGPVGAPTQAAGASPAAPANDGEDALPTNAQPAQGALPTAQAVQAATPGAGGPFPNVSTEDLTKYAMNQFVPAANRQVIAAEITRRATAAQQASDPLRQLQIRKAQQDLEKPDETFGVIGQDPNTGKSQYGFINTKTGSARPYNLPQNGSSPQGSIQEAMKAGVKGDDLYQFLPPDRAQTVKAMIDGRMPPPSTTAMRSPATMQLIDAANAIDPSFDATTWKARNTFNTQFGSQAPSSIGGQKVLMSTALGHLAEVAHSAAQLDNSDGSFTGLAPVGHFLNAAKNKTTTNAAIANALEDKVAKFSGEVGKLYSGSQGGGVHEREDTRNRLGSNLTSAELAAGLEASRDLILSKQKALEDQTSQIFGPERAKKFDFVGPEGRDAINKIEKAIVKMRGQNPDATQPETSPAAQQSPAIDPAALAEARRRGLIK